MKSELNKIKKYYGEDMMHLCKKLFPTILEKDGQLFELLKNNFAFSKFLYDDIKNQNKEDEFKNYILSFIEKNNILTKCDDDPFTLMDKAGYILYECKSEKDVKKFIKYYESNEMICTFHDNRTSDHYVFFAVKKNIQNIKRENYNKPERDDTYGTSVISIQFSKGCVNTLSIKNRYNHTVTNPDATFSNNLENIIPGLTDSFQTHYNLNIFPENKLFELDKYIRCKDGKLYKYNYEIDDIYYGPNNIIIDYNIAREYAKEKYIIADYYIIDLIQKKIKVFDERMYNDGFQINKPIDKIEVINNKTFKIIYIYGNDFYIVIKLNEFNQIISYESNFNEINDNFLYYNKTLKTFIGKNIEIIGNNFMPYNDSLMEIELPIVNTIGDDFLEDNSTLYSIYLPNIQYIGNNFLKNSKLYTINFPKLKVCKNGFLAFNNVLREITLPNIQKIGNFFLLCNTLLTHINFPNLEDVGRGFLRHNNKIKEINLLKLKEIGDEFLEDNNKIKTIDLPSVLKIGNYFLNSNEILEDIKAPNLLYVGSYFLSNNISLTSIKFNNLETVRYNFLSANYNLQNVILPNLKTYGNEFLTAFYNLNCYNLQSLSETNCYSSDQNNENKEKQLVKKI